MSEEEKGPEAGPEGIGAAIDPAAEAHFARAATLGLTPSEKSELSQWEP